MFSQNLKSRLQPRTHAFEAYIEASVAELRAGRREAADGLLFLTSLHESLPRLALQDPVLEPVDKTIWANLWLWTKDRGHRSAAFPAYATLMRLANVGSRATVARSLAILRLTRWVTLCRRVRGPDGQFRGNVYALHEEPLSLADICHLDPEYMAFAEGCTAHRHARVRRIAQALLASLREEIEAGIDVLDDTTLAQADRRAEALATLATGGGGFFAFRESALRGFIRRWVTRSQEGAQQRHARSASERQVQNLNVETPRVQKANPAESVAAQGAQNMNSPPTRFCSSSLNITTTTTDPTQKNLNSSADVAAGVGRGECLVYPEGLNPNECRIAHVTLQALPADLRQSVLDELAERLHARAGTAPAIRNPLGWLHWACRELRAGHMILTSLGVRRQARRARERQAGPLKQSAAARTTPEAVRVGEAALQDMRRRLGRIRSGPEGELS